MRQPGKGAVDAIDDEGDAEPGEHLLPHAVEGCKGGQQTADRAERGEEVHARRCQPRKSVSRHDRHSRPVFVLNQPGATRSTEARELDYGAGGVDLSAGGGIVAGAGAVVVAAGTGAVVSDPLGITSM